jgi:Ras-related protein Rab-18
VYSDHPELVSANISFFIFPKEYSRQVPTAEGQAFATRMNSLFIEASAKTAVGVREAFDEVVGKILDSPELWAPVTPARKGSVGGKGMPGSVNLAEDKDSEDGGPCSC